MNACTLTIKEVTGLMRRTEKRIAWYNTRYTFANVQMDGKAEKEYAAALELWDRCKAHITKATEQQ